MSSPSISPSPSSTAGSITSTPTASDSSGAAGGGAPATATLLFGFLVIFAALFTGFMFLAFFWKIQQRRQTAFLPEFDDIRGSNRGVPKLWEVWIRDDEHSEKGWNWEENTTTTPLSVDVGRVLSEQTASSPTSRSRRPWPCSLFRRRPVRPPRSQAAQQQEQHQLNAGGVTNAEEAEAATGLISGVQMSLVIVMPHADKPDRRRSEISHVSQVEQQQNWRRREYAIGIYHPSLREGWTL